MATYTTYLNLEKPTTSETFNLLKMNQNWDKIDAGVSALNSNMTTLNDTALKSVTTFQVPANSSKVVTITSDWAYSFLVVGIYSDTVPNNGVLFFVNGYVSATRGTAIKLGTSNTITIDMTSDQKQITVKNDNSNGITLAIVPFFSGQSFSVS